MSIEMILGLPDNCKTYEMTRRGYEALEQGIPVYPNYRIGYADIEYEVNNFGFRAPHNVKYWRRPEDLLGLEKGLILCDEPQVYFNSRMWSSFPVEVQYKFQQHSKDGLNIIGATQHQDRIDVVIRELVQRWHVSRKYIGSDRHGSKNAWGVYRTAMFYPEELKKADGKPVYKEWHLINNKVGHFYDTLGKIEFPQQENIITISYKVCSECGSRKQIGFGTPT